MEENWDECETNVTSASNESTSYENWDSTKNNKTNSFANNSNHDSYEADVTLTNDYSYGESTNTGFNELSQSTINMESYEHSQTENVSVHSKSVNGSWDDVNSSNNRQFNKGKRFNSSGNNRDDKVTEDSWGNKIESNSYQNKKNNGYKSNNYGHRQDQRPNNATGRTPNGYKSSTNGESEAEKPVPKSTYVPPEFEVNDDLTIEAGSNFEKYDKIEVTVSGIEVPKNISSFQKSGLRELLVQNLTKCHYITPTPIQKYALPIIMDGRDMIASAQTGSGKTAAFLLPIMNNLLSDPSELIIDGNHCEPQALIMSPTRELAIQICEAAIRLSRDTQIKCEILYGGTATYHQKTKILRGAHIIVATPGRLLDFVNRGLITFSSLRFFVLDEADRMLDMGFQNDVESILNHGTMVSSSERSTVMFSATLPESVQHIAKSYLKSDYISVAVGEAGEACKDVTQTFLQVTKFSKKNELVKLLNSVDDCQGTIVFVEQKRNADFIAAYLSELDFPTTSIHGDREQPEREQALRDFKTKRMKVLVATAVAARGLDISGVTMVVNFDLPKAIEEYVHRIGRTGRLGNSGKAVSFFDPGVDQAIAPFLVSTLKKADQEVPKFLSNVREQFESSNQFTDIRKDVTVTSEILNQDIEEEVW